MHDVALRVEALGKRYRLGEQESYKALRDSLTQALGTPVRLAKSLWNGNAHNRGDEASARTFWALKDVSFDVKRGEVLGIVGRNGAGKSTLLKILSRVTEPTSGLARINGRVGSLLEVGTGFHPELTGRENVFLNGAILGMSQREIRSKFDEISEFAQLQKFLDTPVKRYSSGMFARLAFAVAAHLEPEILIVDEVLAVGDATFQKKCLGKMNELADSGRTVLFVSHNMNAIEELCTSALLLERGQIGLYSRDVRAVVMRYLNDGEHTSRPVEWINSDGAFSNVWFQPQRFALCEAPGQTAPMPVRNDGELWVEIEADVPNPDASLNVGYELLDETGKVLYWSCCTDAKEDGWPRISKGRVVLRSPLPTRLLNEGDYQLRLMASLHCQQWLCQPGPEAPTIHLSIRGGLSDSPYWLEKRPGAIAPVMPWTREQDNSIVKIPAPPHSPQQSPQKRAG